jgi:hypothetical protein
LLFTRQFLEHMVTRPAHHIRPQQHSRTAAKGLIIHRPVDIEGKITDVVRL